MNTVPSGHGTGQPEDPQVDPSGRRQWDAQQQQWVPAAPAQLAGQQRPHGQPTDAEPTQTVQPSGTQPAYGTQPTYGPQPQPQYGAAPAAPGAYAGGPPPQQKKSRKGLLIMAAVAVVVIVVGVVVAVVAAGGSSAKPSATVTTYLEDLENGDASGAVSQGATPASTTFLTDDILKQQQAKARISGVKIISTDIRGSESEVHATYQFGSRSADETFDLTKSGDSWKLTQSTYPIDVSDLSNIPQVTLFGKPIANLSKVYVFPGPVLWGTANKYFTVTDANADKYALSPYDTSDGIISLNTNLSSTGETAVKNAVTAFIAKCAQSKQLVPDGCPQAEFGDSDTNGIPVDGTVTWTAPTDLSGLNYQPESDVTKIDIEGSTVWQDTYKSKAFTNDSVSTITNSNNKTEVTGTVDLTQNPPLYTEQ